MNKDNKNTEVNDTDKKLDISDVSDSLFNKLKELIVEYCSLNAAASIDDELSNNIEKYERYIKNGKNTTINYR